MASKQNKTVYKVYKKGFCKLEKIVDLEKYKETVSERKY